MRRKMQRLNLECDGGVCVYPLGHPHWGGQLCDQPVLRLAALPSGGRAGGRVGATVRPQDGSQRLVTLSLSDLLWSTRTQMKL